MDNIYSTFSNSIRPLPGANSCEPVSCECRYPTEPLNFGVSIFAPVSSVPGSSTFFFLQPLLTGKVVASVGFLIASQIFLFLADRLFGLESMPIQRGPVIPPDQTVRMSLRDLQNFLASVSRDIQPSTGTSAPSAGTSTPSTGTSTPSREDVSTGTIETPEAPLIFALAVWSDFTDKPYTPSVFLLIPVFTFPGLRGALPMLILELLTTIFIRAVVPPKTTGSRPLTNPASNNNLPPFQFSPEDVLKLLKRFNKHFGT
ncbi:hypothetical protein [Desulfosporosinus sp. OT]|uniref:hypothetical protein n=1 Tax=Desulfosporosinus sp. OT TaxID=913865 RepID=UPI0002239B4A|nr:hypothetical protein [Desulfosporosinus sp. OT]EGW39521.1 hypothetical protein DOT_2574 [Desulfosporosinus sp. OT]